MDSVKQQWLKDTAVAAQAGGHTWPEYAASEAGLESAFGASKLAKLGNNLFGEKYHAGSPYGELAIPTKEFLNGQWVTQNAYWVNYPEVKDCFEDRMATLGRLRHMYPHYNEALTAIDGDTFVRAVSKTWSTDPTRADKVLAIHAEYFGNNN